MAIDAEAKPLPPPVALSPSPNVLILIKTIGISKLKSVTGQATKSMQIAVTKTLPQSFLASPDSA